MKKYCLIFLLLCPALIQAKCTLGNNTTAQQVIDLDMTSGSAIVSINTNLNDTFSCNATSDKMYYTTPLQNYIVEFKNSSTQKSIFMQLKLTGNGFPVATGTDSITSPAKSFSTRDVINTKSFTLEANYIRTGTAELVVTGNEINLGRPIISILTDNSCSNGFIPWVMCWLSGKLKSNVSYAQNIIFTVKHKPTTCHFSQSNYLITMPDTSLNEILSGNNTKSGTTNLVLNCDGVYNVTNNPVTFKVAHGDWKDNSTILKNTLTDGAKGVGFQIYSGTATTPLKQGDILKAIVKMAGIDDKYIFPITARYAKITDESLRPGELKSKVVFTVSYD